MDEAHNPVGDTVPRTSLRRYHYYDCCREPFVSLSDLPLAQAERLLAGIRQAGCTFASRRAPDYLVIRRELEQRVRRLLEAQVRDDAPLQQYLVGHYIGGTSASPLELEPEKG